MQLPFNITQYARKSAVKKQLNKAQINNLVALVEQGKEDKEIAPFFNVTADTVAHYRASFCKPKAAKPDPGDVTEDDIINPPAKKKATTRKRRR